MNTFLSGLVITTIVCSLACVSSAQQTAPALPTDQQVDEAIRRGLEYLNRQQEPDGTWNTRYNNQYPGATEALVTLLHLTAGEDPNSPRVKSLVSYLGKIDPTTVYVRALRTIIWARLAGKEYRQGLNDDVRWLLTQEQNGGWGFGPGHPTTELSADWTDNENTQWAVWALTSAAAAGASIPEDIWDRCAAYWIDNQNEDGGWGFEPNGDSTIRLRPDSYGTMTAAGAASLFALLDISARIQPASQRAAQAAMIRKPKTSPYRQPIAKAMHWLRENYSLRNVPGWIYGEGDEWMYYYLWTLVRAINHTGLRSFAQKDWYPQLAWYLLEAQQPDGSWKVPAGGGEPSEVIVRTCFALLTLTEASKPLLISRLLLSPQQNQDSRDAANIALWFSRRFAQGVAWEVISPTDPPEALQDAPILYINAPGEAKFPDSLKDPLRKFILDGGTILVQPFAGDTRFFQYARQFFRKLFPKLEERRLNSRAEVFRTHFPIPIDKQPQGITLGDTLRRRIFILKSDLSWIWDHGRWEQHPEAFQFAANLVFYATDRRQLRGKLTARTPAKPAGEVQHWINVARVRYRGDWDVCPQLFERLTRTLSEAVSVGIRQSDPVDLNQDVPSEVQLLWMTGTRTIRLTPKQITRLKRYLLNGGMLFIDQATGKGKLFYRTRSMLQKTFGPESVKRIPVTSSLLTGDFTGGLGSDVTKVRYTYTLAARQPRLDTCLLWSIVLNGRVAVVISPYGVTCPAEGTPVYGVQGLLTPDARRLASNILLYAATQ